jgi:hypothetical protein
MVTLWKIWKQTASSGVTYVLWNINSNEGAVCILQERVVGTKLDSNISKISSIPEKTRNYFYIWDITKYTIIIFQIYYNKV